MQAAPIGQGASRSNAEAWGGEEAPEYDQTWPCADQGFNCTWEAYKGSNAKFMPSLVEFEGHFGKVRNFFKKTGLPVTGYFQWKLVLSPEDQKAADEAAKEERLGRREVL